MKRGLKAVSGLCEKIVAGEKYFCTALLVVMIVLNFTQVILRYFAGRAFSWSEEIILLMFLWFGFVCTSINVYHDDHIAISFLYDRLPKAARFALDILRHLLIAFFWGLAMVYGSQLASLTSKKTMVASGLSQLWQSLPIAIFGGLMCLFSLVNLLYTVVGRLTDKSEKEAA